MVKEGGWWLAKRRRWLQVVGGWVGGGWWLVWGLQGGRGLAVDGGWRVVVRAQGQGTGALT